MKPLSKKQLAVLGQLSTKAYRHLVSVGYPLEAYDTWRHELTAEHCNGISSWRSLNQLHFVPLCNALRAILGLPPREDHTPKTRKEALIETIRDRAQHWELNTGYISAITSKRFGVIILQGQSLESALIRLNEEELRQLIYTLEARGRAKTAKISRQFNLPIPAEIHQSASTMPPPRLAAWRGDRLA